MISKIKLKVSGKNIDYFLNLLINKGIHLVVEDKNRKNLTIVVDDRDYNTIKKIKTSYKIRVVKVYGLLYIKYLLKTYRSFIVSFIICIILLKHIKSCQVKI